MHQSTSSADHSFWDDPFFSQPFPNSIETETETETDQNQTNNNSHPSNYNTHSSAQDDLFELWCCTSELCIPFDQNHQICNLANCPSTSSACFHLPPPIHPQPASASCSTSTCHITPLLPSTTSISTTNQAQQTTCCSELTCHEDLLDCDCCRAGCPPSPISLHPCIQCDQQQPPSTTLPHRPSPSIITTATSTQSDFSFLSPPLTSSLSRSNLDESLTPQAGLDDQLDQDIIWIHKDLEELIKCCCCDEPTQSGVLPSHHAQAHPTHHVHFDMFDRPSITFPYKPNHDQQPAPVSVHSSIPSIDVSCNESPVTIFKCQWKDCNDEFSDRFKLTEHVNVCHLGQHSPLPNHATQPAPPQTHSSPHIKDLQRITSSDINASQPEPSTSMTTNLFETRHDPLAVSSGLCPSSHLSSLDDHSTSSLVRNEIAPLGHFNSCFGLTGHHNQSFIGPGACSTVSSIDPLLRPQPSQNTNTMTTTSDTLVSPNDAPHHHVCRWDSCTGRIFSSTAELTEHISTEHVGSGKSKYACLWEGCTCITKPKFTRAHGCEPAEHSHSSSDASRTTSGGVDDRPGHIDSSHHHHHHHHLRKVFSQRQKLMRHLQTHTGDKPFQCETCGKKFGEMTTLIQHRRTHTNERPYKCQVEGCGKSFALQSALTIHKRTHTGSKPFKCMEEGCGAQFSESSNLSKHMRIHLLVKKFECAICGKRFTRSDQLSRHTKSRSIHHNNHPSAPHLPHDDDDHDDHDDEEEEQEGPPELELELNGLPSQAPAPKRQKRMSCGPA